MMNNVHNITRCKAQYVSNNNVKWLLSGVYMGGHKTEIKKARRGTLLINGLPVSKRD